MLEKEKKEEEKSDWKRHKTRIRKFDYGYSKTSQSNFFVVICFQLASYLTILQCILFCASTYSHHTGLRRYPRYTFKYTPPHSTNGTKIRK